MPEKHRERPSLSKRLSRMGLVALATLALARSLSLSPTHAQQDDPININLSLIELSLPNERPTLQEPSLEIDETMIPPFLRSNPIHIFGKAAVTTLVYVDHAQTPNGTFEKGYIEVVQAGEDITDIQTDGEFRIIASETADDIARGFDDMGKILLCNEVARDLGRDLPVTTVVYERLGEEKTIDCGGEQTVRLIGDTYSVSFGPEIMRGRRLPFVSPVTVEKPTTFFGEHPHCALAITGERVNGRDTHDGQFRVWSGEWALFTLERGTITPVDCDPANSSTQIFFPQALTP